MRDDAFQATLKRFEDGLVPAIYDVVIAYETTRRAYCLALNYGDPLGGCLPVLGLGMLNEGEIVRIPAEDVTGADEMWWNPAEFSTFADPALDVRSEELLEGDRELRGAVSEGAELDIRGLCNRLAVRLNTLDWTRVSGSNDFIVYAVDDDLADLNENLAIVRAARREN